MSEKLNVCVSLPVLKRATFAYGALMLNDSIAGVRVNSVFQKPISSEILFTLKKRLFTAVLSVSLSLLFLL